MRHPARFLLPVAPLPVLPAIALPLCPTMRRRGILLTWKDLSGSSGGAHRGSTSARSLMADSDQSMAGSR